MSAPATGLADPAIDAARIFRAALDAMARPGTVHAVAYTGAPPGISAAAAALLLTLADPDTPVFLAPGPDTPEVRRWLTFHTGAPCTDRGGAALAVGTWAALTPIDEFRAGTPDYPDRSATLIVERTALGRAHRLTGPGIDGEAWLEVPDVQEAQANRARFPLGIDLFLTADYRLAALPRSTVVEG